METTKKISLYDINAEQRALIDEIEASEGELTPEIEQALIINEKNRNQKSIAYLEVLSSKKMFNSMVDDEIKRLQALKKRNLKVIGKLEDNLLLAVKTFGSYQVGLQTFGTRKSNALIVEVDVNELPELYRTKKLTITPDKKALKEAIQSGEEIDGVRIEERQNLKIN